jgi:hypothetical protein
MYVMFHTHREFLGNVVTLMKITFKIEVSTFVNLKLVSLLLTLVFKIFFRSLVLPVDVFRRNAQCLLTLRYLLVTVEP